MVLPLVMRLFTGEAGIYFARLKRVVGLYIVLAILAFALLFFLVLSLFVWSSQHFGVLPTALASAGVAFVLMIVVYVLLTLANRRPAQKTDDRLQRDIASIAGVTALSNAPQILRAVRRQKSLLVVPVMGAAAWGLYLFVSAFRRR